MKSIFSNNKKFFAILILCFIPALYLVLLAEDRFQSVSKFSVVVKGGSNAGASMGLLDLVGVSSEGASDSQIAIGFISSSDMLLQLEKEFGLIKHYTAPKKDFIFRLKRGAKKEDRIEYYRNKIHASTDPESGLMHLTVESYSRDLSREISAYVLNKTEEFINTLNKEIASRRLSFAQDELDRAQNVIKQNKAALIKFQNQSKIIQPEAIIQAQLEAIQTLRLEKIHKEIELATLEASSPKAPTRNTLKDAISYLDDAINKQEAMLSGPEAQNLNQILAQYQDLKLNLELALNLRKGAELILEQTRAEAIATSRFFSVIQHPYLPDDNSQPRRLYYSITMAVIILLVLYVIRAIIASIYDRV